MKETKKVYRENFEKLRETKGQVFYIQQSIDTLKQKLVSAFEEWFSFNFDDGEDNMSTLVSYTCKYFLYSIDQVYRWPQLSAS